MSAYHPSFASPIYLALLATLPWLWWLGYRRLAVLGRWRRWAAILLRTVVVVLMVLAAADLQIVHSNDGLTVIYVLDQSLSIPAQQRAEMLTYVHDEVHAHRRNQDRAGVIVFGGDAVIEQPVSEGDLPAGRAIESTINAQATDIAAALKLAQAAFVGNTARRIVLVTDGNENQGNALEQARAMGASGIGVDVVPIRYHRPGAVAVERVIAPAEVRRNEPFDLRVVLSNDCELKPSNNGAVRGKLRITKIVDDQPLGEPWEEDIVLPPGKKVFNLRQSIDSANFYTYEARFIPDRPEDDGVPHINRATAFTHVAGKGQVLLIVNSGRPAENEMLAERLRRQGLEVSIRGTDRLFSSLADLQAYDTVVLAGVPRATSDQISFSDEQIEMLVRNTQQMGAGLVMLGGPESFGAGGWAGTALEKAMPVDFQIRNAVVVPGGALVMVIDKSGSMAGQKIGMCKAAAIEAAKVLGPQDYVGVVAFDVEASWIVPMRRNSDQAAVARGIGRLGGDGGTNMSPGMLEGYHALLGVQSAIKHMILLTDGDTMGSGYADLAARMRRDGITVTSVAVGADANRGLMQSIAEAGGGQYYFVNSPRAIPRIFQREARRVTRSLLYENDAGVDVRTKVQHEMLSGIDSLPPIKGYVLTSKKNNPLAETVLFADKPVGEENSTILAGWQYGLGRAVALTTDIGSKWTPDWAGSAAADKLFGQIVRWSMRPSGGAGGFTTTFEPREGKMRVVVTALDNNGEFLNFLATSGTVVGPDLSKPIDLEIEQTAPGRYVSSFAATAPGSYFVTIDPGGRRAPLRTGVTVPFSDEFRDRTSNDALLSQLAGMPTKGAPPGQMIENKSEAGGPQRPSQLVNLHEFDTFRHDLPQATSSQEAWHWLVFMASCVFLADVFIRRVNVNLKWLPPLFARARDFILRREPGALQPLYIERLKSRKAEVSGQLAQLHADARFNVPEQSAVELGALDESALSPVAGPVGSQPSIALEKQEESYTERLLKAKKKAIPERDE